MVGVSVAAPSPYSPYASGGSSGGVGQPAPVDATQSDTNAQYYITASDIMCERDKYMGKWTFSTTNAVANGSFQVSADGEATRGRRRRTVEETGGGRWR